MTAKKIPSETHGAPVHTLRNVPVKTKVLLAAVSAGRCQFRGCNQYLFEHPLTLRSGNFSQMAHIVAFSDAGPRGDDQNRPTDTEAVDNLMLLCATCHKEVDSNPKLYSRGLLQQYKLEHEERVRHVTGLGPDVATSIVQLKARIAGQAVDIPIRDVFEAVVPRYPLDRKGHVIDLSELDDSLDGYLQLAAAKIARDVTRLYETGLDIVRTRHISLFALAPIPLLVHLGRCLSNKIAVDMFQRHRNVAEGSPWAWRDSGPPLGFTLDSVRHPADPKSCRAALVLSLSGSIALDSLPTAVSENFAVYELRPEGREPGVDLLRTRDDLDRFRQTYRAFLAQLTSQHPGASELHLFPAVPAPVAVACGHDLLPKVHPPVVVHDYDRTRGGFIRQLRTNDNDTK